jgi:O-antigen chain-terminating methyltransferase
MDKLDHPEINTSELTAEVRKAIARQALKKNILPIHPPAIADISTPETAVNSESDNSTQAQELSTPTNFVAFDSYSSPLPKSPTWQLHPGSEPPDGNDGYQLNDLLQFQDVDFVNVAYRVILKREPDPIGYNECLDQLREGHLDKIDLIWSLRFSPEGELKNVKIRGLALPALARRLGRLPIIGYPIRLGTGLLRLPSLIHRLRRHEAYSSAQSRRLAEHANKISEHIDTLGETLAQHLSNLSAVTAGLLNQTEVHMDQHGQTQQQLKILVEQQHIAAELRHELASEINTREQTQKLIQEQLSLFQASTNDARDRMTKLESFTGSAHERINQIEMSNNETRNQITQIEASANTLIAQLETSARAWIAQLESTVRAEIANVDASTNDIRTRIVEADSATGDLRARLGNVESVSNELRSTTNRLETSTNTVQTEIEKVYQQLHHARTELALQGRRMALILEEARRRLPAPFDQQQLEIIAAEEQHKLDALYAELEDNFRGSHEEIKNRFRAYLPHINSLDIADDIPIVDLGSGRGEWLELLREEGYTARGVDSNRVLLERCRARGLDVVESDALQYLRGLPDDSLAAITGFHIIEHLEIGVLMQLLDETVRVVQPGGLVIFETPNPENVLVGSNYFYFDPTHRNPLPGLLMKFLLESRGLQRVEVMNLHAWDQARIGGKNALTARFNDLFYGPMDYAIAGWKVSA